jgi:hypothetical protein
LIFGVFLGALDKIGEYLGDKWRNGIIREIREIRVFGQLKVVKNRKCGNCVEK